MSQPPDAAQPSTAPQDQPGGSQEPARGRKRRAPTWSSAEIVDLIQVWGEASNVHDLRTSHRNAAVYSRMAASLAARGHQRSREQVRCKIKDLRQSYSRACQPGADPEACPHFQALDRILGAHAVYAPRVVIDPGAEGPLPDTEEEELEDAESQESAQDPQGTPLSTSLVSSEAGEASTSAAPGTAGRTTLPATATRARASRRARNQEDYQQRHLWFLEWLLRNQEHWIREDLRPAQFGGAGGAEPCPQRPPPDPGRQVPAFSCSSSCSCPSSRSSSHPCFPSRFLRSPVPPAPPSKPAPPQGPRTHSVARRKSQPDPPSLSFPFPSSPSTPFQLPPPRFPPPLSHPHSSLPPPQLCTIKRDFVCQNKCLYFTLLRRHG
ncbi:uncharacterized protein LOC142829028 [Pelodiscus sinensis]|uniref:uncharacterized protein LOC142829028 n=1 Tax=Pelodiscus sinensis TaxID=13735 RepID=UPI003F6BAC6E